jgi:8-oxo-dGTP pyrophosphatase MutT (NUDIX family)
MGSGILPTTIHNGKLYFLFGKEGKYEDTAPGFSDFGGGTDNKESFLSTAIRESCEEFTGFLGDSKDIRNLLTKHGTYNIDYKSEEHGTYRTHIFPFEYNHWLPYYYNNNQRFLQKHMAPKIFKTTKIFEKAEIRWVCVDDLKKMRPKFRFFFVDTIDKICSQQDDIKKFILNGLKNGLKKSTKKKTLRNKMHKNKKTRKHY